MLKSHFHSRNSMYLSIGSLAISRDALFAEHLYARSSSSLDVGDFPREFFLMPSKAINAEQFAKRRRRKWRSYLHLYNISSIDYGFSLRRLRFVAWTLKIAIEISLSRGNRFTNYLFECKHVKEDVIDKTLGIRVRTR